RLWACDTTDTKGQQGCALREAMKEAVRVGALCAEGNPDYHSTTTEFDGTSQWLQGYGAPIKRKATAIHNGNGVKISRDDFQSWLEQEDGWPLPGDCLLRYWWNENAPTKRKPG